MKKAIVIGPSGAGKSEFSRRLSALTGSTVYHLDNIYWNEDKTHVSRDEFDRRLNALLSLNEWIIDGDYSRTYEPRFSACDTVFFLDYPLETCLDGVRSRLKKPRNDIPWVEEEIDEDFMLWIENWKKDVYPKTREMLEKYSDEKNIVVFSSREQADAYLGSLKKRVNRDPAQI